MRTAMRMIDTLRRIKSLIALKPTAASFLENILNIGFGKSSEKLMLRNGIKLYAPGNHPLIEMAAEILYQNCYTSHRLFIAANDIVVDIGANIGIFSILAARRTNNQIHAFEPVPKNVQLLKKNIRENGLKNVSINQTAVCDRPGQTELYLNNHAGGHSLFVSNNKKQLKNCLTVAATTLPDIIDSNKLSRVDFLKIDCEGAEGVILKSTATEYLQKVKQVAIEFHDNVSILSHQQIQDILHQAGFATQLKWDGRSPFGLIYGLQKESAIPPGLLDFQNRRLAFARSESSSALEKSSG